MKTPTKILLALVAIISIAGGIVANNAYIRHIARGVVPSNSALGGGSGSNFLSGSFTMSSVAVDSSSKNTVFSVNTSAQYRAACNNGAQNVYLALANATSTANKGVTLYPGACIEFIQNQNLYIGVVTAITASGTSTVSTVESTP